MSNAAATFIADENGRILLLRRGATAPWMPNKWNLPGGKVDPGETPERAAIREAMEETRLTISALTLLSAHLEEWGTLHLFFSTSWKGTPRINWESSEMKWMTPQEALASDLVPGLRAAFAEMAAQSSQVKQNPLLSRPPKAEHRLRNTKQFRDLVGRAPTEADYHGVHTTTSKIIAQAYAMGTWRNNAEAGYPVVITLDVSGLEPFPDVDAMLRGGEATKHLLSEYRRRAAEGESFYDQLEDEGYDDQFETRAGDDPASFVFETVGTHPLAAIESFCERYGHDAQEIFDEFLRLGTLQPEVLMDLVKQKRFMHDFDLKRVVRIEAVIPWWSAVLWSWDNDAFERADRDGYHVFTMDEWPFPSSGTPTKVIWEAPDADRREEVEFHGTASPAVAAAFPTIRLPLNPWLNK